MATKSTSKKPAVKKPAAKPAAKKPAAKKPAENEARYPWLKNRLVSAVVAKLPADADRTSARKALRDAGRASDIFAKASEFGFDVSADALTTFLDDFIDAGETKK